MKKSLLKFTLFLLISALLVSCSDKESGTPGTEKVFKTIIVINGGEGATLSGEYEVDCDVTVFAGIKNDYNFDKWEANGIILSSVQETQSLVTFTMPDNDVTLTATWKLKPDWTLGQIPFMKGVNFNEWLDDLWSGIPPNNRRWFDQYNEDDFINLKSIGIDHIRLPVALHTNAGRDPNGVLDSVFLAKLDEAVNWAEKHEIYLIIDNHEYDGSGIDASIEPHLINAWRQIAERYKDRSKFIIYEILNEPCYIEAEVWNAIQGRVIDEIRKIDTKHYIIVGGTDWNSMWQFLHLPIYPHDRIIYTFHFYEPSLLTHAGVGALADVRNIPFPYDSARMPSPPSGSEEWVGVFFNKYSTDGTEADIARQLDEAVAFANENNIPIYIGEYGCNSEPILQEDRVRYYETVTRLFRERGIPHSNWGYKYNEFGMTNGRHYSWDPQALPFPDHLNVDICRAMGLNPPEMPIK